MYDTVIVGGGIAGILAAGRLAQLKPQSKIALLEMEAHLGGKYRNHFELPASSLPFPCVPGQLKTFLHNTFPGNSTESTSPSIRIIDQKHQFLFGNFLAPENLQTLFPKIGVEKLTAKLNDCPSDATVKSFDSSIASGPAIEALSRIGNFLAILDVKKTGAQCFHDRSEGIGNTQHLVYAWDELLDSFENVEVHNNCPALECREIQDGYEIRADGGEFQTHKIIIAHNPWDALQWLDRDLFPLAVLKLGTKSAPVSAVSCELLLAAANCPPTIIFETSMKTWAYVGGRQIRLETHIDYESSLSAPNVLTAVRQLRKLQKKLNHRLDIGAVEKEQVSLEPSASSIPYIKGAHRLSSPDEGTSKGISFCGGAYGSSYLPAENTISSVNAACTRAG